MLATTCAGCHGVPGSHNAYPAYHVPKLGGQNADYLEVALQGYRRGTRSHPTMQVQAATLSDQDIADIAAYFSTYEGEPASGKSSASAVDIEAGKRAGGRLSAVPRPDGRRRGASSGPRSPGSTSRISSRRSSSIKPASAPTC